MPSPQSPNSGLTTTSAPQKPYRTLLLKTRSAPTDAYTLLPTPTYIPVLTHTLLPSAPSTLRTLLSSPPTSPTSLHARYSGLILTSQRAVEALGAALTSLGDGGSGGVSDSPSGQEDGEASGKAHGKAHGQVDGDVKRSLAQWQGAIFVVGPATARAVRTLLSPWLPSAQISGENAGNGGALAQLILESYHSHNPTPGQGSQDSRPQRSNLPLLFLVGETRRDIIPRTLQDPTLPSHERVGVEEMVVYETRERDEFAGEFEAELQRTEGEGVRWVVVFSPTGCEAMLRVLGWSEDGGRFDEGRRGVGQRVYVASIGPTTREFLRERFGFEVDVCAEKPSPDGVRRGIEEFMVGLQGG
ncbi:MAG: hypothetical protein MMC23_005355 [Stictis urceolatum]|nr:hypothetical protein [Stictis urceolata]